MKRILAPLLLSSSVFLGACSSVSADADWDPSVDFSNRHTWSFLHETPPKTGNPEMDNDLLHKRVRKAIQQSLGEKNLRSAGAGEKPDLLVAYAASVTQKVDVDHVSRRYDYHHHRWDGWVSVDQKVRVHDVGNLILDLLLPQADGKTQLAWRGSAQAYVGGERTPDEKYALTIEALRKMLAYFPPPRK